MSSLYLSLSFAFIVFGIVQLIDYCDYKNKGKDCFLDMILAISFGFWAGYFLSKYIEKLIGG